MLAGFKFNIIRSRASTARIVHQHADVRNIISVEVGDFEVVGRLRYRKLFAGDAFYLAERAVGEENFVTAL